MSTVEQGARARHRRPSGEAPALPRELNRGDRWFLGLAAAVVVLWLLLALTTRTAYWVDRVDHGLLDQLAAGRSDSTVRVARLAQHLGSELTVGLLRLATVIAVLAFRRFRHLFVLVGCYLTVDLVSRLLAGLFGRARPLGYDLLGDWEGFSHPSLPVAALSVTLVGACFTLAPSGRPRWIAGWAGTAVVAVLGTARVVLGVDHPSDVLFAAILATTITMIAFRVFTPDQVFPVTYGGGKAAHLEIGEARAAAIRRGVREQLGVEVSDITPIGLAGSAGSTPLLLTVADEADTKLFAKLYAANHVRSDRWYKLGRTILYGRLEDEQPFSTVRRLVQYEDYMLRVMRDASVPTAEPFGFVEITPEREYLLVTEFVEGSQEITDAPVDDAVIDDALRIVRLLWDGGLAHRDIKPANVLVAEGRVILIDVAFGEIRPSPWRQAVDLANMMLVLATRTDPERVYRAAVAHFTPDEVAEAFAATRGVTSPTQLRGLLRRDGRDLVGQFRALAPPRRPIVIQRWSLRRIGLIVGVLLAFVVAGLVVVSGFGRSASATADHPPECPTDPDGDISSLVVMAQSVPRASLVPCVEAFPAGWSLASVEVTDRGSRIRLDSDRAGDRALIVDLDDGCEVAATVEVPSDEEGTRRFEEVEAVEPGYRGRRVYTFDGGCATYTFDFGDERASSLLNEASLMVGFAPRESLRDRIADDTDGLVRDGP